MGTPDRHEGRAALVVGGASGIGAAVAAALAGRGWRVLAVGSRPEDDGAAALAGMPGAQYVRADMRDDGGAAAAVAATVDRFGRLDSVVYSAGATVRIPHADLAAVDDAVWQRILGLNVLAPWRVVRAAEPHLREAGDATITLVGALGGVDVGGSSIPYSVSKAALHHMVRLLGGVLGPQIRINAVAPGLVDTPWTDGDGWAALREHVARVAPLRRSATPEDIAATILALMDSPYTTGQTLVSDGGLSLIP